jgi:hypothetical protein
MIYLDNMTPDNKAKLKYKIPLLVCGLIGAGIIFYLIIQHGAGTTPDSVYYISVARHIADGIGIIGYDGYYLVLQPPLYPLLLAGIKVVLLIDPFLSAGYVNSIIFGLIIFVSGLLFLKYLNSYVLVLLGTISILISYVFVQLSLMALSEPLFILLIILYLYYLGMYQSNGKIFPLILFSIAASMACLTRYIGIILIIAGVISINIQGIKSFKTKLKHLTVFLLITCLPIGLWFIRNFFISGTFVGKRADSSYTVFDNLRFAFNTFLQWFMPVQITNIQLMLAGIVLIVLAGVLIRPVRKNILNVLKEVHQVLIPIILYSGMIIISSTTTAYDHIANRLLSPIYVPVFLLLLFICDKILNRLSKYYNRAVVISIFSLSIMAWMIYPVWNSEYIINDYNQHSGFGFSSYYWDNRETINYLLKNKMLENKYTIYSNVPEAVYLFTNKKAMWSPAKTFYNSPQRINPDSSLYEFGNGNEKLCLVWFSKIHDRKFLYSLGELKKAVRMKKIAQFKDGEIYSIEK